MRECMFLKGCCNDAHTEILSLFQAEKAPGAGIFPIPPAFARLPVSYPSSASGRLWRERIRLAVWANGFDA